MDARLDVELGQLRHRTPFSRMTPDQLYYFINRVAEAEGFKDLSPLDQELIQYARGGGNPQELNRLLKAVAKLEE